LNFYKIINKLKINELGKRIRNKLELIDLLYFEIIKIGNN